MAKTKLQLPFKGELLRLVRELRGLDQKDLALRCQERADYQVSRARISAVECGDMPSPGLLKALTVALDCSVEDLLDLKSAGVSAVPAVKSS